MNLNQFIFNEQQIKNKLLPIDSPDRCSLSHETFIASAILFLIIPHKNRSYDLVLIRRVKSEKDKHSGEMSFPGGKWDPMDDSLEKTALRECEEELGIVREKITVLGSFNDHITPKKFCITPIVAYIDEEEPMKKKDDEVQEIITIPISYFTNKKNYQERTYKLNGDTIAVGKYIYRSQKNKKYVIFGATSHMIVNFIELVYNIELKEKGARRLTPDDFRKENSLS